MSGAKMRRSRRIEFADTDASGRAHFTAVLRHAEAVEHELLGELGIPVIDAGGGWPRARVECDFCAPLVAGEEIEVLVEADKIGESSMAWRFEILASSGETAARGRMTTVWVGPDGKSAPIPAEWRGKLLGS